MKLSIVPCLLLLSFAQPPAVAENLPSTNQRHLVVLMHGLGRTRESMKMLEKRLLRQGYEVHNLNYPSRKRSIDDLVEVLHEDLTRCCVAPERKIHFVTHSLGGILVRAYLKKYSIENLGRVVMMSPPNQGSEIVDLLRNLWLFQKVTGPAGQQLGTDSTSVPNSLGPVTFTLGIITGNRSINPFFSWMIPGPDDGQVAVERAKVEGMTDFLIVPYGHTFIMRHEAVAQQTVHFLRTGHFRRAIDDER
jgi:triacylglycerol lipase